MNRFNSLRFIEKTTYILPHWTVHSSGNERSRLILAINDAEQLGFDATKAALVEMLEFHEAEG